MTSLDGDGSAQNESPADRSASLPAGGPPDQDPVRLTPPADPWLTEAPTAAFGDAAPAPRFGAANSEVPPDDVMPAVQPYLVGEDRPPRRRRKLMVFVLLVACGLLVASVLAINPFGSGDGQESDPSTGAGATPSVPAPAGPQPQPDRSTPARPPEVIYEVTASGSRNTGSVSYTDQDGEIIRRGGIPLPWRTTFTVGAERRPLVLIAQRKGGGNAGPVTCTITVDGKLLASTTAEGKYAAPQCSGSGNR